MIKASSPRVSYLCVACRFTSKHTGLCPLCQVNMTGLYDFAPPRKTDNKGWRKVELALAVTASTQRFCRCWDCTYVPRKTRLSTLTLSQYKAWVHEISTHQQGKIPKRRRYALL